MFERFSWLAWFLQFLFGAIVGLVITAKLSRVDGGLFFIIGAALIFAGLAGKYGDRLWAGRTSLETPTMSNNALTNVINYASIGIGCLISLSMLIAK